MNNLIILLTAVLSLTHPALPDPSFQENIYEPNPHFYNLIFSEKFPPQVGRTDLKLKTETKPVTLNPGTVLKEDFTVNFEDIEHEETSSLQKVKLIFNNLKLAFQDFVDVDLIRAFVDLGFDGMSPKKRKPLVKGRNEATPKSNESIRRILTFMLGGLLGKQDCASRTLCELGKLVEPVKGKSLIFMISGKVLPKKWKQVRSSIDIFEKGTLRDSSCDPYVCQGVRNSI